MGHAVTVYAVAALLIAASAGPILATVRDAGLKDFEDLDEPRSLNDFPFLKQVEPYLPPMIVDWLIIRPDRDLDLPDDVGYRVDADGRVILVWPDGCEETQEQFRDGSVCDDPAPDCEAQPFHPECLQEPPTCPDGSDAAGNGTGTVDPHCPTEPECEPWQILDDGVCVMDPACEEDDTASRPEGCPEGEDPGPQCPTGTVPAWTGKCIPTVTHQLEAVNFSGTTGDVIRLDVQLLTHYANLSIEIHRSGFPLNPGWQLDVFHQELAQRICWVPKDDPHSSPDCTPGSSTGTSGAQQSLVDYPDIRPIPPGNLTVEVEYNPGTATISADLEIRLYGRPTAP